jgi:hypothetical protein
MMSAITAHGAFLSEAAPSYQLFTALSNHEKEFLLLFLDSLGRAEFDHEGDNDIDLPDFQTTHNCLTGPQPDPAIVPDEPCAISDVDQDGDVDLRDLHAHQRAMTGPNL